MMAQASYDTAWDEYGESFRIHAHQLLAWAHSDVRVNLNSDMVEPDITGLLADAMRKRLNHFDTPDCYDCYWVDDQDPVSPNGERGIDRLRLDISVVRTGVKPRLVFVFEAKRLRTQSFPIGLYTGPSGMGGFIDESYAQDCPEAAMVALWQNRNVDYWLSELLRSLLELSLASELKPMSVVPYLTYEWYTLHQKKSGRDLRIFHIFLECY